MNDADRKLAELTGNNPYYHLQGEQAIANAPESELGKAAQEELDAFRNLAKLGSERNGLNPGLTSPPGTPLGPGAGTPGQSFTPAGPTGPNGTQLLPPTGPNGTQVIPEPVSPTGQTQQVVCPECPASPYATTQTGMGGVVNALGQKSGG